MGFRIDPSWRERMQWRTPHPDNNPVDEKECTQSNDTMSSILHFKQLTVMVPFNDYRERNADLAVLFLLVVVAIKIMFPSNRPFSGDILF
jgi:hypothetical protein